MFFNYVYMVLSIIFSKSNSNHLEHLRKIFTKCRKFGISLNPKKCMFSLFQGNLLGHVVSKDGISIDPKRVVAIHNLDYPWNTKEVQSFLGTIIFLCIFISNFAEILREIINMLGKENQTS